MPNYVPSVGELKRVLNTAPKSYRSSAETLSRLRAFIESGRIVYTPISVREAAPERETHANESARHAALKSAAENMLRSMGATDVTFEVRFGRFIVDVWSEQAGVVVECGGTPADRIYGLLGGSVRKVIVLHWSGEAASEFTAGVGVEEIHAERVRRTVAALDRVFAVH